MRLLYKCLILSALGLLAVPATVRAQFAIFGRPTGPSFGSPYGGAPLGVGAPYAPYMGMPYGMGAPYGFGSPYGGYGFPGTGYGGYGAPYYSGGYVIPIVSTVSTATAAPRMRPTVYPAITESAVVAAAATVNADTAAHFTVHLPAANATVWLDNVPTKQTGLVREFVPPPLDAASSYTMEVRASWLDADGSRQNATQQIELRRGDQKSVIFPRGR